MFRPHLASNPSLRRVSIAAALLAVLLLAGQRDARLQSIANPWSSYGHDAQHTAMSSFASQSISRVHWSKPVDLFPQYSNGDLFIHYGSPLCTAKNTVIFPIKTGASGGYRFEGHRGSDGLLIWSKDTDYILPPHNWTPSVSALLTPKNRVYLPLSGGRLFYRDSGDSATPTQSGIIAFYGLGNYTANPGAFNNQVYIITPITSDRYGNIFFGVLVNGSPSPLAGLQSCIVRITPTGAASWTNVAAASPGMSKMVYNCAPALSNDHRSLYVAVNNTIGWGSGRVLKLDSQTLAAQASVDLKDVKTPSAAAGVSDDGTASPTIGPDGDVYFGVLEASFPSNHARGWLLHFSGNLSTTKIAGPFGWDDTASIVPSGLVHAYSGASKYLVMTKYNNYAGAGGNGVNKIGIFDPNQSMVDPISGATVMREVISVAGQTPDTEFTNTFPNAVREWCINTAAVDASTRSILVNSEDGWTYRWDLSTNTLSQRLNLQPPTGEAYTPTIIGVDGTVYSINNATLCAIGK